VSVVVDVVVDVVVFVTAVEAVNDVTARAGGMSLVEAGCEP
jgi:hypothetical protein